MGQKLPHDLITKVVGFIMSTRKLRHSMNYPMSFIGNKDEMPLWLDMPGDTTSPDKVNDPSIFTLLVIKRADSLFFLQWLMEGS